MADFEDELQPDHLGDAPDLDEEIEEDLAGEHGAGDELPDEPITAAAGEFKMPDKVPWSAPAEEFIKFVRLYPNKSGTTLYVYAAFPKIDLAIVGRKFSYLVKLKEPYPATEAEYIRWLGGGVYELRFTDSNTRLPSKNIAVTTLRIDHLKYMPKLIPFKAMVRSDPATEQFRERLVAMGKIDSEGNHVTPGATPAAPAAAAPQGNEGLNGVIGEITKDLVRDSLDRNKGPNMVEMFSLVSGLLEKKGAGDGGNGIIAVLLQGMQQQNQLLMAELLKRRNEPAALAAADGDTMDTAVDSIHKLVKVAESIGLKLPFAAASPSTNGLAGFLDTLLEKAPALIPQIVMGFMMAKNATAAPAAAGYPSGMADIFAAAGAAPNPAPAPGAAAGKPEAVQTINGIAVPLLMQMANRIYDCLDRGIDGEEFAQAVYTLDKMHTYQQIKNALANPLTLQTLKTIPSVWQRFEPFEDQIPEFIEKFCHAFDQVDEDEDPPTPDDEATGAAASGKGELKN